MTDPAAELITAARAGDQAALEQLARWCYPIVQRWALTQTGDADEADDVTQETMAALPSRLASFKGEARFSTWLFRVVANVAGGRRRVTRRRLRLLERWWRPEPPAQPQLIDSVHRRHLASLVVMLLQELPPQQRVVFDLADLQHFEQTDIAAMLELDKATVRSHLMRARRTLRARMLERLPTLAEDHA